MKQAAYMPMTLYVNAESCGIKEQKSWPLSAVLWAMASSLGRPRQLQD